MKKLLSLISVFFLAANLFALGAGVQVSCKPSLPLKDSPIPFSMGQNITGTFKTERVPAVIAVGLDFFETEEIFGFGLNATADYLFFETQLKNITNIYGGLGITGDLYYTTSSEFLYDAGIRAMIGVNFHLYDGFLELYVQEVFSPVIQFLSGSEKNFAFKFPLEAGFRIHF